MAPKARGREEKHRRRAKNQLREIERFQARRAGASSAPPPPPSGFVHAYGQGVLLGYGPLIHAVWSVPAALKEALVAANEQVPAERYGVLLLDTGACRTAISMKAAGDLRLKAVRLTSGYGSGGKTNNPMYLARLAIRIGGANGSVGEMAWEAEVEGIPDLDKPFSGSPIKYAGADVELIGLLGRDVLRHTRFSYDGVNGTLNLNFDLHTMQVQDFRGGGQNVSVVGTS